MNSQTILRAMYKAQLAETLDIEERSRKEYPALGRYWDGIMGIAVADDIYSRSYQRHNRQWWRFYSYLSRLLYEHDQIVAWNANMQRKIRDGEVMQND